VECTSAFIEYDLFNGSGKRSIGFSGFNVILKSARNTLSRLVALLISLGYGLVMNKIGSYQTRIMLMCFSFFVAHIIHTGSQYIRQYSLSISVGVSVLLNAPLAIVDVLFALWIGFALRRTLLYLHIKNQ